MTQCAGASPLDPRNPTPVNRRAKSGDLGGKNARQKGGVQIASYHLSLKPVSRAKGRSATAAAAYRAGECIADAGTGEVHDYTRKRGIVHSQIVLPADAPEWARDRSQLWNQVEAAERRKDALVAREVELALPAELSAADRQALALDFAQELCSTYGVAIDVAIHEPHRRDHDERDHETAPNHHAHLLMSTRALSAEGWSAKKVEALNGPKRKEALGAMRERWADLQNERLAECGHQARVDHRSLEDQGIDRAPQVHLGPTATAMERRGKKSDRRRMGEERQATARSSALASMTNGQINAALRREQMAPEQRAASSEWVSELRGKADTAKRAYVDASRKLENAQRIEAQWRKDHRVRALAMDMSGGRFKPAEVKAREVAEAQAKRMGQWAADTDGKWKAAHRKMVEQHERRQRGEQPLLRALECERDIRKLDREMERGLGHAQERDRGHGLEPEL